MGDKPTPLCCPNCGNQQLYSEEDATIHYPVYVTADADGDVELEYGPDFGERQVNDDSTTFKNAIYCRSCGAEHTFEELLTPRKFAHLANGECHVDEDSDKGAEIRFQAVCWAKEAGFECSWASLWQHARDFGYAALEFNEAASHTGGPYTDPAQLAHEAAAILGREHMKDEGVEVSE